MSEIIKAKHEELIITMDSKTEDIEAQSFVDAIAHSLEILRAIDGSISMKWKGTLRWVIGILSRQSPAQVSLRSISLSDTIDYGPEVIACYINGMEQLKTGRSIPQHFPDAALDAAQKLARIPRANIRSLQVRSNGDSVEISEHIAATISELIEQTYVAVGSIEGVLEMVTLHERTYFRVYDAIHGQGVPCYFTRDLLPIVQKGLGQRVAVSGTVRADRLGRPESMRVSDLRLFPDESKLPKPSELRGLSKGMTDGRLAEDYLEELRGDNSTN